MNAQAHISGQISGQVPNQAGSQLSVLPQHNGSALPPQMQNVGGLPRAMSHMDPELLKARQFMQEKMLVAFPLGSSHVCLLVSSYSSVFYVLGWILLLMFKQIFK